MRYLLIPAAVTLCYAVAVAVAWRFQGHLIYLPGAVAAPPVARVLPGAAEARVPTADGLALGAWVVPAAGGKPRATVVVCNGNAGDRAARAPLAAALAGQGIAVVLFDYRGYGGNPGVPNEAGLSADLAAVRRFVTEELRVPAHHQVLFGESLGAAVALAGAVVDPPAGLVLRSPFTSLVDAGRLHYPLLPVGALLRDRYPSLDRIGRLRCPLLVVAGERDQVVPPAQSRALFDAAPEGDKRFVLYPGAGHNSARFLDDPETVRVIAGFAARVGGGTAPTPAAP